MYVRDGWVKGAERQPAQHIGSKIRPTIVVLHDTASRLKHGAAASYLAANNAKVSVQFVIERNGALVQQVPVDRRANHAGQSKYHGREGCNAFSIGIEIVNPGKMTRVSRQVAEAWMGARYSIAAEHKPEDLPRHDVFDIQEVTTPEHGAGLWMSYSQPQLETLISLLTVLFRDVSSLKDIVTHWYISPGRKIDTNPLFPLEQIRARILGRDDPVDVQFEKASKKLSDEEFVQIDTDGDTLNMRRWPSFNPNVIAEIPDGATVPVLRRGTFDGRTWLKVFYGGQEGWIVAAYAAHITKS